MSITRRFVLNVLVCKLALALSLLQFHVPFHRQPPCWVFCNGSRQRSHSLSIAAHDSRPKSIIAAALCALGKVCLLMQDPVAWCKVGPHRLQLVYAAQPLLLLLMQYHNVPTRGGQAVTHWKNAVLQCCMPSPLASRHHLASTLPVLLSSSRVSGSHSHGLYGSITDVPYRIKFATSISPWVLPVVEPPV